MDKRLFEDLVVSTRVVPARRRSSIPVSIALHGGALALLLLVPTLRQTELPTPGLAPLPVWDGPPVRITSPPPVPTPPPGITRVPAATPARRDVAPSEPAPEPAHAPGPPVSVVMPDSLPTGDAPQPCLFNCAGAGEGDGSGDGSPTSATSEVVDGAAGRPVVPGGKIKAPVRTVYVAPVYPPIAVSARLSALVIIECIIDPSGRVSDARVLRGHPLLDEAALSAVRQWRYTATRLNDVPVPVLMTVTVRFMAR